MGSPVTATLEDQHAALRTRELARDHRAARA
jgi:hypothetical protein